MILPSIHHIAWKTYDDVTNTVVCTRCQRRLDCKGWAAPCVEKTLTTDAIAGR
jgi:hypothetical protein